MSTASRPIDLESLVQPPEWGVLFGRRAPIEVDVGFGKGEFLIENAIARPASDFVGIERSRKRLLRTLDRLERRRLRNVVLVYTPADEILDWLFHPGQVSSVTVNHPDPWPKKRHHRRRLIASGFASEMAQCLAPGGAITVATDNKDYADSIAAVLCSEPLLRSRHPDTSYLFDLEGRIPTLYESRYRAKGRTIFYLAYERRA